MVELRYLHNISMTLEFVKQNMDIIHKHYSQCKEFLHFRSIITVKSLEMCDF